MSVQVDNMLVFQLHYRLRPVGGGMAYVAPVSFPASGTGNVPLSITDIGSSALTPSGAPSSMSRGSLTYSAPAPGTPSDGLLLSTPMAASAPLETQEAPAAQSEPPCPAAAPSLDMSDDTIACMLNGCGSTQFSAFSNGTNTDPSDKTDAPKAAESKPSDTAAAAESTGDFTEVFAGRGHSPAAFAAFESALETVKATMGRMEPRETVAPAAHRPSASSAGAISFAGVSAACGLSAQPAAKTKELEISISESTLHNILSVLCDNNSTLHAAPEGEGQTVKPVSDPPAVEAPVVQDAELENNIETTQESEGDAARRLVRAPVGPHAKIADAILRNIERKRKLVAVDSSSERDVRRKRMRRITPTYMGPLSESHRFIVGHFPAT